MRRNRLFSLKIHNKHPYFGARRMSKHLAPYGIIVGRKSVGRYYRIMAIEAVYPKMNLSKRNQLRSLKIGLKVIPAVGRRL